VTMAFSSVHFRTFVHATEDEEKVLQAMRFVSGLDEFERNSTTGHHGNTIIILEGAVREKRNARQFFRTLSLEDIRTLLDTLELRLDDDCFLFARLDKQQAYLGVRSLTTSDDAIAIRAKVESYPKKRENAMRSAHEFLEGLLVKADEKR
jgi:RNA binding exosome subunit